MVIAHFLSLLVKGYALLEAHGQ